MQTLSEIPVTLTASAIAELKRLMSSEPDKMLRVGVKGGGCSGLTYVLEFDHKKDNDMVFDIDGIPCIMDKSHAMYLLGMEIDWSGGLQARGFTFKNPNASTTCGCGTSFGV